MLPNAADPDMAKRVMQRWRDASEGDPALTEYTATDEGQRLLNAVFGNSPFLSQLLVADPPFFALIHQQGFDAALAAATAAIERLTPQIAAPALMTALRRARRQASLAIALADITGAWPLETVTRALSTLADCCVRAALRHLLAAAAATGDIVVADPARPDDDCGVVIVGVGKLGAFELNYSSDIDVLIFYDPDKIAYRGRRSVQEMCERMTRGLVRLLAEPTEDGFVFRVDLRLRPDPRSTPPAMSLLAAETYYEGFGQNWERAALIKARILAGDADTGRRFLDIVDRFIWRRHLDFAAIRDIHSIKRQINQHGGGERIAVAGHNLKLGRGGIREIEFFAQTQQLIRGGRDAGLRAPATLDALAALAGAGHITADAAGELADAYRFLRRLEHRLQMVDERQTHALPNTPEDLRRFAVFAGFDDVESFADAVKAVLTTVERHYAHLFEDAAPLSRGGNLVFTGIDDDPETLQTLATMGFAHPATISADIRAWHHGRVKATHSARARELLTELVPTLLEALSRTADPDTAFQRFDRFLAGLPVGVPLFALLTNNPGLFDLLIGILAEAPRLADWLSRDASLLDGLMSPEFLEPPPDAATLTADLTRHLGHYHNTEAWLDAARRWCNERKFRLGMQVLHRTIDPLDLGPHLTDVAEAALRSLPPRVEADFIERHGPPPGDGLAIVAFGKMGSREMTATSDLDLIFIYDPRDGDGGGGGGGLDPGTYFARLTQRIVSALTARTVEGVLYPVDMRLRPSGNSGPVAVSLAAFRRYQAEAAWTWEHMALTRARVVAGPPALGEAIETVIASTLQRERDPAKVLRDVADMRARMAQERKPDGFWDVKLRPGGLVDIEFIAQWLQLTWAHRHPSILRAGTGDVLAEARRLGVLDAADATVLEDGWRLWTSVQQLLRQAIDGPFHEDAAAPRLRDHLAAAAKAPHFEGLKAMMTEQANQVHALFGKLIATPAAAQARDATPQEKN
jgi:glutamate-ammonia-ligase adenylyltransferase